jgi:hypothetical protein
MRALLQRSEIVQRSNAAARNDRNRNRIRQLRRLFNVDAATRAVTRNVRVNNRRNAGVFKLTSQVARCNVRVRRQA